MSEEAATGARRTGRERAVLVAIAALLLISLVVAIAVLAGGEGSEGVQTADGMIVDADEQTVIFRPYEPIDGRSQLELAVPLEGRPQELDVAHLQEHAEMGEPVRMHYERSGDGYIARAAYDLPGFR